MNIYEELFDCTDFELEMLLHLVPKKFHEQVKEMVRLQRKGRFLEALSIEERLKDQGFYCLLH